VGFEGRRKNSITQTDKPLNLEGLLKRFWKHPNRNIIICNLDSQTFVIIVDGREHYSGLMTS